VQCLWQLQITCLESPENANLAISVLEPEMDNGFVFYRVLDANMGDELPVYRLIKKSEAFSLR